MDLSHTTGSEIKTSESEWLEHVETPIFQTKEEKNQQLHVEHSSPYAYFETQKQYLRKLREKLFTEYMQKTTRKSRFDNFFCSFNGWQIQDVEALTLPDATQALAKNIRQVFSPELIEPRNGGYFLRWNSTGIVINPAKGFLDRFTAQGHHIQEIDYVIVTSPIEASSEELEEIYLLNKEINKAFSSYETTVHVIQYLLHPCIYSKYIHILRPQYRQEVSSVQSLESFSHQHEEQRLLSDSMSLLYRSVPSSIDIPGAIAIRFELYSKTLPNEHKELRKVLGFISDSSFKEWFCQFFSSCNVMVLGIQETDLEDIEKLAYQPKSLGYFGTITLLHSLAKAQVALISEWSTQQGDIRLEILKKIHQEKLKAKDTQYHILPSEVNLTIELDNLHFISQQGDTIPLHKLRIAQLHSSFTPLTFLSSDNLFGA